MFASYETVTFGSTWVTANWSSPGANPEAMLTVAPVTRAISAELMIVNPGSTTVAGPGATTPSVVGVATNCGAACGMPETSARRRLRR